SAKRPHVAPGPRNRRVHGTSGNRERHLGTHSRFAPDLELTADQLGALTHAAQTEVTASMVGRRCPVDALAIVTNTELKLAVIVAELHFNPTGTSVPERIAQRLAANPINVVPNDRAKVAWRALDRYIEWRVWHRRPVHLVGCELLTERAERD